MQERVNAEPASEVQVDRLLQEVRVAANTAIQRFPQPNYVTLKVAEESGEVVQAAVHAAEGRENLLSVRKEIVQAMAMLLRLYMEGDQHLGLGAVHVSE